MKTSSKITLAVLFLIGYGIFALVATDIVRLEPSSSTKTSSQCDSDMAFIMSRKFVREALKSPSSAEFPSRPTAASTIGTCKFAIQAHVDAQNSFGAKIRSPYYIEMEYLPGENVWRGANLRM